MSIIDRTPESYCENFCAQRTNSCAFGNLKALEGALRTGVNNIRTTIDMHKYLSDDVVDGGLIVDAHRLPFEPSDTLEIVNRALHELSVQCVQLVVEGEDPIALDRSVVREVAVQVVGNK